MTADDFPGLSNIPSGDVHLPPERLAALADEPATPDEDRHLIACPVCATEVRAHQSLLALTRSERDRLDTPVTSWTSLRPALIEDGLLDARAEPARRPARGLLSAGWTRNAAAAVLLLASGAALGRLSLRDTPVATGPRTEVATVPRAEAVAEKSDNNASGARLVNDTIATFKSKQDALAALLGAENQYRHAAAYLMVIDSGAAGQAESGTSAIRTRLAALDEVAQTTRAALYAAPEDPVLTQYYLSSLGAREATLRELGRGLPKNVQLNRY